MKGYRLAELAQRRGLEFRGDADYRIQGICTLMPGKAGHISFVAGDGYRKQLADSQAGAVILCAQDAGDWPGNALISNNPQADYAHIAALFDPYGADPAAGVHPTASVDSAADIDASACVGAGAVVAAGAVIGAGSLVGPGSVVGRDARIGRNCRLVARVTLCDGVQLGDAVHIQPGAVIGGRGFGLAPSDGGWLEIPQLGSVRIGNNVEIGANSCVDRGAIDDTVIGDGVKIDNLVQVGHNTVIGEHTAIAGCVGIAGSCRIGARCQIGGAAGILGHLQIADDVVITAKSLVSSSITEPGLYSSSLPVQPASLWRRQLARLRKLDELYRRIKALEKKTS